MLVFSGLRLVCARSFSCNHTGTNLYANRTGWKFEKAKFVFPFFSAVIVCWSPLCFSKNLWQTARINIAGLKLDVGVWNKKLCATFSDDSFIESFQQQYIFKLLCQCQNNLPHDIWHTVNLKSVLLHLLTFILETVLRPFIFYNTDAEYVNIYKKKKNELPTSTWSVFITVLCDLCLIHSFSPPVKIIFALLRLPT